MTIGDLKTRLRNKFIRKNSTASTLSHSSADLEALAITRTAPSSPVTPVGAHHSKSRSVKSRKSLRPISIRSLFASPAVPSPTARIEEKGQQDQSKTNVAVGVEPVASEHSELRRPQGSSDRQASLQTIQSQSTESKHNSLTVPTLNLEDPKNDSTSTADFPTPNTDIAPVQEEDVHFETPDFQPTPSKSTSRERPAELVRKQSILPEGQTTLIETLLETELPPPSRAANLDYFVGDPTATVSMVSRKIWVKRPGGSATLVPIQEDDLVDDVREMILRKYQNSLGRSFDAPDVVLRIIPREPQRQERILGPEEEMARTLDAYFPGGQTVAEALVIDVPHRRTPKPSPQPQRTYYEDTRPTENGTDYFPIQPVTYSPHIPGLPQLGAPHHVVLPLHSMSVINTGQVPLLPSPGSTARRERHPGGHRRPIVGRTHTSSPSAAGIVTPGGGANNGTQYIRATSNNRSRTHSVSSEKSLSNAPPTAPPIPSPAPVTAIDIASQIQRTATPPAARVSSPRPTAARVKKAKKAAADHPSLPAGMLNGGVPPINVLIVEDNIINLKLLEAFMKRLKVRWQTAMNGREAVTKWRAGGFHLVLMDIQLPIMSGLEATKEIRRLERLNSIGVFSSSASSSAPEQGEEKELEGEDKLPSSVLFKSPVIIVALTASSLQSDRHEALAAGCNDFLTKPVNFVWLERKVMEWGCMQALIDFDGWRKWKDFSQQTEIEKEKAGKSAALAKKKKANRASVGSVGGTLGARTIREEGEQGVAVA